MSEDLRIDEPFHAGNQPEHVEIDQESGGTIREAHVRQRLRLMYWQETLYGLHFDDDHIFHEEIDAVLRVELQSLIANRNRALGDKPELACRQLQLKARHVGGFKETGTEDPMHLDSRPDDVTSDDVNRRFRLHVRGNESAKYAPAGNSANLAMPAREVRTF
jgi:hypothetical protein